jgi:SOS response regulatory protein OraA/RecX
MESQSECFNEALRRLSYRLYCEKEIRDHLFKKGYTDIEKDIEKLKELGYINDMEFVRSYVSGRGMRRKMSLKALFTELKLKMGKSEWLYDKIYEFYNDYNGSEEDIAENVFMKKLGAKDFKSLDNKEKQKLKSYLLSKGFDYKTVKELFLKFESDNTN